MVKIARGSGKFYGTASKLHREYREARESQKQYLVAFEEQLRKYHTRHYTGRDDGRAEQADLENHYHDWISYIVPKVVYQDPRAAVTSPRAAAHGEHTVALRGALNRWVKQNKLGRLLASGPAVDMQFNTGVVLVQQEPMPGGRPTEGLDYDDPSLMGVPHSPKAYRIPQDQYFEDAVARQPDQVRFRGHILIRDRIDIEMEAQEKPELGWNLSMVRALNTIDESEAIVRDPRVSVDRGEVPYVEIWVPEAELDEFPDGTPKPKDGWRKNGFNGVIFTLPDEAPTSDMSADWLRPPRPYYGPPCGPYALFGTYTVPNRPKKLAPLQVVEDQVRDLNRHTAVSSRSAADYKRLILITKTSSRIKQIIADKDHHYVAAIPGFEASNVQQVEVAGITDQMIAYIGIARDRLNRNSHMDDARRGEVDKRGTATAVAEAAASGDVRVSWVEKAFEDGVEQVLTKVLWYLYMDNRVAYPLGSEAAEELGMEGTVVSLPNGGVAVIPPEPWFHGGKRATDPDFDGLEVSIEPFSMERADQGEYQQNLIAAVSEVLSLLPLAAQFGPGVNWKRITDDIGLAHNILDLSERFDWDEILQQAATMAAADQQPVLMNPRSQQTSPAIPPRRAPQGAGMGGQPGIGLPGMGRGLGGARGPGGSPAPAVPGGQGVSGPGAGAAARGGGRTTLMGTR